MMTDDRGDGDGGDDDENDDDDDDDDVYVCVLRRWIE